jgi:hypothetical protein
MQQPNLGVDLPRRNPQFKSGFHPIMGDFARGGTRRYSQIEAGPAKELV